MPDTQRGRPGTSDLEVSGAVARRDAEALIGPATDLVASGALDRRQVRAMLPHVLVDVPVALLLVDRRRDEVVYANHAARALAGDVALPVALGAWGRASRLTDLGGEGLGAGGGLLERVLAAAPSGGEAVRAAPLDGGSSGPTAGIGQLLWATGIPLTATGDHSPLALLMLLEVASPPGGDDPEAVLAALRNRAVIATDLAFTISDPSTPDNQLRWVNPAFTRMTGYSAEEAVGANCRFLQGADTDPEAVAEIRAGIAERRPVTVVVLNYRRDGTPFWNQLSVSPVFDGDGGLISFVGVQYDVSQRVRADAEREAALGAERAARLETERARSRMALLAEVTTQLAATLDTTESLERLADLVVPALADWVAVHLTGDEGGATTRLVVRHRDGMHELLARYHDLQPAAVRDNLLIDRLMAGGEPVHIATFDRARLVERAGPEIVEVVEALGFESALYVPLVARQRRVLGTMVLVSSSSERVFGEEDLGVAADLGRRAGITLDNARLYEQEHRVAEILQRSLLPAIPKVPGAAVSASYLPANAVADVGGDFYEILALPDGSIGVAVGDVVGHDMSAAAAMGHLRGLLRACAWDNAAEPQPTDPGHVLDRVDRLVQGLDVVPLATLLYARAAREGDRWRLWWANAGHPAPLLRLPDGSVEVLGDGSGLLLGAAVGPVRTAATRLFPAGSVLLGFTDGLIERRGEDMDVRVQHLAGLVAPADPSDLEDLVRRVVDDLGDERDDDVALIAVRFDHAER